MSVSVEGSQTPLLGREEGENEKHFRGWTGWKTPLEAPSRLDRGKEGSAHLEEARGYRPRFLPAVEGVTTA